MRRMASSDVPGFSTQCIRKSYSLKFGQELLAEERDGHGRRRRAHGDDDHAPGRGRATTRGSTRR